MSKDNMNILRSKWRMAEMIKKIEEKEDEVFFKFELDRLDLFHLSAILSAVAYEQEKVFEEFGEDAYRLMRKLYMQTHKE